MSSQILEIALRVQAMREICDYGVEEMARRMELTVEEYTAMESGTVDIPISFLTRVAPILGVEVTALLTGKTPKLQGYSVCRSGKGMQVHRMNRHYAYHSLAYGFKHKTVEPFHVTIEADDPDADVDLNSHNGQEFDYVLEGVMKLCIGQKQLILTAGDSIYFDSNIPHGMKAINSTVKFMALVIPPIEEICQMQRSSNPCD